MRCVICVKISWQLAQLVKSTCTWLSTQTKAKLIFTRQSHSVNHTGTLGNAYKVYYLLLTSIRIEYLHICNCCFYVYCRRIKKNQFERMKNDQLDYEP